jgi:hypothetical protein
MADTKFINIEYEDDPERCQALGMYGQCKYKAQYDGANKLTKYCPKHTPGKHGRANYRFNAAFAPRIDELVTSESIKNLREEIGLVRMTLEAIVNRCKDEYELSQETDRISKLVDQINKLVISCHKIEESSGQLLDKNIVVTIGAMIVNIVSKHIPDAAVLDKVGCEIYEGIETITSRDNFERLIT